MLQVTSLFHRWYAGSYQERIRLSNRWSQLGESGVVSPLAGAVNEHPWITSNRFFFLLHWQRAQPERSQFLPLSSPLFFYSGIYASNSKHVLHRIEAS